MGASASDRSPALADAQLDLFVRQLKGDPDAAAEHIERVLYVRMVVPRDTLGCAEPDFGYPKPWPLRVMPNALEQFTGFVHKDLPGARSVTLVQGTSLWMQDIAPVVATSPEATGRTPAVGLYLEPLRPEQLFLVRKIAAAALAFVAAFDDIPSVNETTAVSTPNLHRGERSTEPVRFPQIKVVEYESGFRNAPNLVDYVPVSVDFVAPRSRNQVTRASRPVSRESAASKGVPPPHEGVLLTSAPRSSRNSAIRRWPP